MGLFNKLKDILFEDEEVEEPKKEGKKEVKVEHVRPIAEKIEPQKKVETPAPQPMRETLNQSGSANKTAVNNASSNINNVRKSYGASYNQTSERELFKSENTFPFPDFDEEEFSSSMTRQQPKAKSTNVLEYEKKKKIEKKYDYGRYERTETREVVEKKKFKPSPIISPVYGILNEDYKIEDIKDKTEEYASSNNLDFNSVRKKAFGEVEKLEETPKETFYEETVTVKLKENDEEKKQKVKTIDELLEDTADVEISLEKNKHNNKEEKTVDEYEKVDEDLEELIDNNPKEKEKNIELDEDDDTLENDLFDLIDSMYDNREDGDY